MKHRYALHLLMIS